VVVSSGHTALAISIAHTEDHAIAAVVAAGARVGVGVDLARIGEKQLGFRELAFDAGELALLARRGDGIAAMHRAWCAKEATLKAFGHGLDNMPNYRCEGLLDDGVVEIGATHEDNENERLRVTTWTDAGMAFALLVRRG